MITKTRTGRKPLSLAARRKIGRAVKAAIAAKRAEQAQRDQDARNNVKRRAAQSRAEQARMDRATMPSDGNVLTIAEFKTFLRAARVVASAVERLQRADDPTDDLSAAWSHVRLQIEDRA